MSGWLLLLQERAARLAANKDSGRASSLSWCANDWFELVGRKAKLCLWEKKWQLVSTFSSLTDALLVHYYYSIWLVMVEKTHFCLICSSFCCFVRLLICLCLRRQKTKATVTRHKAMSKAPMTPPYSGSYSISCRELDTVGDGMAKMKH